MKFKYIYKMYSKSDFGNYVDFRNYEYSKKDADIQKIQMKNAGHTRVYIKRRVK